MLAPALSMNYGARTLISFFRVRILGLELPSGKNFYGVISKNRGLLYPNIHIIVNYRGSLREMLIKSNSFSKKNLIIYLKC